MFIIKELLRDKDHLRGVKKIVVRCEDSDNEWCVSSVLELRLILNDLWNAQQNNTFIDLRLLFASLCT